MAVHVGLDPARDINWVTSAEAQPMELFAAGKIDAFISFAPEVQEVRARGLGHAIVNTAVDRPWSQYFCCMVAGDRDYVQNYPVATKRVLRAILKAADLCAADPEAAARLLVDRGYAERYDYAVEAMREIRYDRWREYDPADTVRFYALRLHEAGMIKSAPSTLIAAGTDWHILDELREELRT
jgi:NitT/TauT family transport system substrate-binding protein